MTPFNKHWSLVAAAMLFAAASAEAQQPDPLRHLIAEALRNNLGYAQEAIAERRAASQVREARGAFFPSLQLESRYSEQMGTVNLGDFINPAYAALNQLSGTNRFPTNLDITLPYRYESRVRLVQPLFNEAIRGNYSAAQHRYGMQEAQRLAAARRLAAAVQVAYLERASARQVVAIYETTLERVTESGRAAQRLMEAGRATADAVYRARADKSEVEQQLDEARERAVGARRQLNQLLGRPLEGEVEEIPDSLLSFQLVLSVDEALAHGLAHREELRQVDEGLAATEATVRIANAAFAPSVAIAADYGFQGRDVTFGRDRDFAVASLVVSWNLFNGGRDLARRQGALDEADRLQTLRRDLEERIRLDVCQAYDAALVARTAIQTAEDRVLAARRTFELVRRRYEEGLASYLELVDARGVWTSAELNRSLTFYRYAIRYVEFERAAALRVLGPSDTENLQ